MPTASSQSRPHVPPFDSPEQGVFLNLWRTFDCLKALEEELFGRYGLSAQQYNALRLLRMEYPAAMQTLELGKRLISRGPDTTRMLDRLEKQGWIARNRRPENRRVVEITLTEAGLTLLEQMGPDVVEMHERQLGHLSAQQRLQLVDLLRLARAPHEDASCGWLDPAVPARRSAKRSGKQK
ncbi:MAG: MarR family transcriptional regulator [Planctomycetaceae bacterium]|nr:MarR family transcriptional regulator [Planctomycetaceae bacterium]